jgi:adenylate kinase family enzyme
MQRVLVIGSGGAGKSTFAAGLAERLGLPVIHLDALYWKPGWIEPSRMAWEKTVNGLLADERWVMDGNYGGTLEMRLAAADTVIFLDLPRTLCIRRVVLRRIRFRGRSRPDMTPGCPERLTWEFLRWIWRYPVERRPGIQDRLARLRTDQRAIVLRSPSDVEEFLRSLPDRLPDPLARGGCVAVHLHYHVDGRGVRDARRQDRGAPRLGHSAQRE